MPTVTVNFTSVKGINDLGALAGVPTSVSITNLGTSPNLAGKLGWLSIRFSTVTGIEQFGMSCWFGGKGATVSGLPSPLRGVFIAKKAGLSLRFTYTYP